MLRALDPTTPVSAPDGPRIRRRPARLGATGTDPYTRSGDTSEVAALLRSEQFADRLSELAAQLGRDDLEVRAEAAAYLREMAASRNELVTRAWSGLGRWMLRAHDVVIDQDAAARVRDLDRSHPLIFLFSHRSYLDAWLAADALADSGIAPAWAVGGGNLNFFPLGTIASRTGLVFVRRSTADLPVYRLTLRAYIGRLVENGYNLGWSIEGGRTRTGKLRPPAYGILRYVVDAVESVSGASPVIVPISMVYDQLHEVGMMTQEATGGHKRPEDIRWLVNFGRSQRQKLGRAYLDFGEPIHLADRIEQLRDENPDGRYVVERIALDTMHRINRATPVTTTAVVCLALLAHDRALTLDEVLVTLDPVAGYITRRGWPVAGAANLTDRFTVRRALQELVASGVLASYAGGTSTVWTVAHDRHLEAAFYRNTVIHILVDRAIGELALLAAAEAPALSDPAQVAGTESLRLRELLKFDFFFPSRQEFAREMEAELAALDAKGTDRVFDFGHDDAVDWLSRLTPLVAPLVLRPFLDAYRLVADRLIAWGQRDIDEQLLLDDALRVGRQWVLQRRMASPESLSLELFRPALRLARHRNLLDAGASDLDDRRRAFADEVDRTSALVDRIERLARPASVAS